MVLKLLANGVRVHMRSKDSGCGLVRGLVMGATAHGADLDIKYLERYQNGTYDTQADSTMISRNELEQSTLTKQDDGSYLFDFPNDELENPPPPWRNR